MTPPSTGKIAPVTHEESSEARYSIAFATSSGIPILPIGCSAIAIALSASFLRYGLVISVSTIPGQTQFTRILYLAYSTAQAFVSRTSAPFDAVYASASKFSNDFKPASDETLTMQPFVFIKCGIAAFVKRNCPVRFTSITSLHSSSEISCRGFTLGKIPALFTRMSILPKVLRVIFTTFFTSAFFLMSPGTAKTFFNSFATSCNNCNFAREFHLIPVHVLYQISFIKDYGN